MTIRSWILGAGIGVIMAAPLAVHASVVNVGNDVVLTESQPDTLLDGAAFTLDTTVFYDSATSEYTYQYNLANGPAPSGDADGLALFAPTVSSASDFGTTGLTFFFGGQESGGVVTTSGSVGNDLNNTTSPSTSGPVYNSAGTLEAVGHGARIQFETTGTAIGEGQSNVSEFGDYFYVQSASAPGTADINVSDMSSQDFPGPTPGAPEPSSLASFAIGGLGLLALVLRTRKSRQATAV